MQRASNLPLSTQMKRKISSKRPRKNELDGDTEYMVSTGSTLLDLAISGGRVRGGGMPTGILVEIFGPEGSGKTVLLCELAGAIQRAGGSVLFHDPEARLNIQFSRMFGLQLNEEDHAYPNRVPEVFKALREWSPPNPKAINGVFADSLAALSTATEMDNEEGDKMGMRRAKEFSEELRKTCRIIARNNYLMVCSNQVRQNIDAGAYATKTDAPGGMAMKFYSSLRIRSRSPEKIIRKIKHAGKDVKRVIGVETTFEVVKSSIWKPYRTAQVVIIFDYGVDDIRANLQFIKDNTNNNVYAINGEPLSNSMDESIAIVEERHLENDLREEVIDLWEEIESKFDSKRKEKTR
jgi:recombination protein RecA